MIEFILIFFIIIIIYLFYRLWILSGENIQSIETIRMMKLELRYYKKMEADFERHLGCRRLRK